MFIICLVVFKDVISCVMFFFYLAMNTFDNINCVIY